MKFTERQISIYWINARTTFLKAMMKDYCEIYDINNWKIKFVDTDKQLHLRVSAYVNSSSKTMYVNINLLDKHLPKMYIVDLFKHEFAHILEIENRKEVFSIDLNGSKTKFASHGRRFRKYCSLLNVGKQLVPNYKEEYKHPQNELT